MTLPKVKTWAEIGAEQQFAGRLEWLKSKRDKAIADYHFANGYRAGIEEACRIIERGEDIAGYSIDNKVAG
jgi:hypothetical protein